MAQSFSLETRQNITRKMCSKACCARAELAAALCMQNGVSFRGFGRYALTITTGVSGIAFYYVSLIKKYFGIQTEVRVAQSTQLGEHTTYEVAITGDEARTLMEKLGLYDENALFGVRSVPFDEVTGSEHCKTAFLRSAFLISGFVADPEQAYQLEIAAATEEAADYVKKIMKIFELSAKTACRKSQFVVYLKSSEMISDFLTRIGCHTAVMSLENVKIVKEFRNNVNRQSNCDFHNIDATLRTAEEQIRMIDEIDRIVGLETLSAPLQEIAKVRRQYTDVSLAALGEYLDPPLGKSGVNARMRKLRKIYDELTNGG